MTSETREWAAWHQAHGCETKWTIPSLPGGFQPPADSLLQRSQAAQRHADPPSRAPLALWLARCWLPVSVSHHLNWLLALKGLLCMWQLHLSTSNYQPFWNKKKFYVNHVRAEVSITEQELTEEEYALSFHFFSFEKSNFSFLKNELSFPLLPVFLFIFLPVSHSAKKPELTFVFSVMVPHTFSHPPALQLHFLPVSGFIFILFPSITAPFSHLIGFLAIQNMVRNITILYELHSTKNINYTRNIYFVF